MARKLKRDLIPRLPAEHRVIDPRLTYTAEALLARLPDATSEATLEYAKGKGMKVLRLGASYLYRGIDVIEYGLGNLGGDDSADDDLPDD